jgi:hypothetical protein
MDVKNELEKLTKNIYIPMVFYIPYALFPNLSEDSRKKLDDVQFFNTMGIFNIQEDVKPLIGSISSIDIAKKSSVLKRNFIQLVEFEGQLSSEAFSHVINEYLNSAHAYNYIYTWMVKHVENDIPSIKGDYKNFFIYQEEALNQHILELNDRFLFYNKPIETTESFNDIFEKGKAVFTLNNDLKSALIQSNIPSKKPPKITPIRKDKFPLPTDEDVDDMLLKSVFNVNISEVK